MKVTKINGKLIEISQEKFSSVSMAQLMEEIQKREEARKKMIASQIKKGCDKCSQWDEYYGCDKCERM